MNVKDGVTFSGVRAPILWAMSVIEHDMESTGEYTVTSVTDGKHGANSFHYVGCAFDLRTRHMKTKDDVIVLASKLRAALGRNYDVVVEKDHIHIEVSDNWVALNGDPRKVA